MPSDAQKRYYEKNRETITAQMRERDAQRRADRKKHLEEHPEEVDLEREKMRGKYHNWTGNKCKKQMEAWIADPEVKEEAKAFFRLLIAKNITPEQFSTLLHWVILSLYTEIQPRRNQDYLDMWVVKKWKEDMPKDKNYLDLATHHFIFNKFKTQKTYGQQKIAIPEELMRVVQLYLKHHPLVKGNKTKTTEFKFLVFPDGTPLTAVNAITRILNRVFGKKIGSSMLRHIFLSSKYDIKEMETDATAMGHSVEEQKKYLRGSGEEESIQNVIVPMLDG